MKKHVFLFLMLCSMFSVTGAQEHITMNRFEGEQIRGVETGYNFEVRLRQGEKTGVVLTIPARLESQLECRLKEDGVVKVGFRGDFKYKNGEKCTLDVVCSSLSKVDLSGASRLTGEGNFSGNRLEVDLSGASQVNFTGEIKLLEKLDIEMSGASKIEAKVEAPGTELDASGASKLILIGSTDRAELEASGAVVANLEKFIVRLMEVDLSGSAKATLNVSELLKGEASGASKVVYSGNLSAQVSVSGAAQLKKK